MGVRLVTAATQEPVSLAEARAQCRIDATTDDATLAGYLVAARQWVERVTGRLLAVQTIEVTLDNFPGCGIELPAPVGSVTSITYTDTAGVDQTVASYLLDVTRHVPILTPTVGQAWPATNGAPGNVRIRLVAGEAQPPEPLRLALLMLVAHWNENREAPPENLAVDALIAPYRVQLL